jgi:hypothetical protein
MGLSLKLLKSGGISSIASVVLCDYCINDKSPKRWRLINKLRRKDYLNHVILIKAAV